MIHPHRRRDKNPCKSIIIELRGMRRQLNAANRKLKKAEQKLDAVRRVVEAWGRQRDDPYGLEYDWYYKDKYYALEKALEDET